MITGFGLVCVNVLDMDQAREFYVGTLGFEIDVDMVQDGFHWLVVHAPQQPEVPLMLVLPGPPVMDGELAQQIRSLVATGFLGPGAFATDDCWTTYHELKAKGVEFIGQRDSAVCNMAFFNDPDGNSLILHRRYAP